MSEKYRTGRKKGGEKKERGTVSNLTKSRLSVRILASSRKAIGTSAPAMLKQPDPSRSGSESPSGEQVAPPLPQLGSSLPNPAWYLEDKQKRWQQVEEKAKQKEQK